MGAVIQNLWAKKGRIKFPGGAALPFWGFASSANGKPQIPGPLIKARAGDLVTINLYNHLKKNISLLFPGQQFIPRPVKENGVFVSYNTPAAPGDCTSYSFTAARPGVFLYESGTSPEEQVSMGLYGALVIYPRGYDDLLSPDYHTAYCGNTGTGFDVEKVLILGELDSRLNMAADTGSRFNMPDYNPDHLVINGRSYPHTLLPDNYGLLSSQPVGSGLGIIPGQRVLLRIINAGLQNHTFRLLGITARVVAVDGWPLKADENSLNATYLKNTITVAPGESYDLIFTVNGQGQYFLHHRDFNHPGKGNRFPGGMATRLTATLFESAGVPAAPLDLSCALINRKGVKLSWKNSSTGEEGFVIERKITGEDNIELLAILDNPGRQEYTDSTVLPGISYSYRICAYNSAGASKHSNICRIDTNNIEQGPEKLTCTTMYGKRADLAWSGSNARGSGYAIERRADNSEDFQTIAEVGPNTTFYRDLSVVNNTIYTYRVKAVFPAGAACHSNECVTVPKAAPLSAPDQLRSVYVTDKSVFLVWDHDSSDENKFHIERKTGAGPYIEIDVVANSQTWYTDKDVQKNGTYYYRVRTHSKSEGFSDYSYELLVNTP
ncbi:multicopper oxidase [Desulfocucumis palustris]|uniref:Multicopper oxidase n=1 Tax=Desulfocucumis palustris TaxID=1898651 RepID=A0A2L2X9V5_9FIRM|nr:multicopper oxidase domain-containing protein [Desulfocucumis palustris]GBF32840.1 multicopper oxidase [Desulfocucumis palustris]